MPFQLGPFFGLGVLDETQDQSPVHRQRTVVVGLGVAQFIALTRDKSGNQVILHYLFFVGVMGGGAHAAASLLGMLVARAF